jgi:hypothetical protein
MICQQYKAQGCHSGLFHMIQLLSSTTAYHEQQDYRKSEPPHYYNASVDKRMNQVAFLQILVPGSETLPTSANICLLNQPLLSKPLLVVAVDIHLTCASLTQSGGARMGRQDSQSFVMLRCSCFFVIIIMSYHVSDIL